MISRFYLSFFLIFVQAFIYTKALVVDTTNAPTFAELQNLVSTSLASGGDGTVQFSESMTYDIADGTGGGFIVNGKNLNFETTNGASVTFNFPENFVFGSVNGGTFSMNGNFVLVGAPGLTLSESDSTWDLAFMVNVGTLALTGVTLKDMVYSAGAIYNNDGTVTLNSVTFTNNQGDIASAIFNNAGHVTLSGVTIDDSSVTNSIGGQIYNNAGGVSGSLSTSGNTGAAVYCQPYATCSTTTPESEMGYAEDETTSWTQVTTSSWADLQNLMSTSNYLQFSQSMTFNIPADSAGFYLTGNNYYLETTNGATVTFNFPTNFIFADVESGTFSMNGDFVLVGAPGTVLSDDPSTEKFDYAFSVNLGKLQLTGVTMKDMVYQVGAINNNQGTVTLNSVTFSNNQGEMASAIFNNVGQVTLTDVTIDDSSVTNAAGGQIYNNAGSVSGSLSTSGNTGVAVQCFLGSCSTTATASDTTDDDENITWTQVTSSNGATWAELTALLYTSTNLQFTETMTYTLPDQGVGLLVNGNNMNFETTNGATVTFNLPANFLFAQVNTGTFNMNGDFVISGTSGLTVSDDNSEFDLAFSVNVGTVALTGVTIQNMVYSFGAISNNVGSITLDSVTFTNNQGELASAIYNSGGTVTLSSVTIQDSSVANSAGGQIYNLYGSVSGSFSQSGNSGSTIVCNPGSTCSVSYSSNLGKNAGKIAGIVIGVIVALCCLGGVVAFFLQKKKRKGNLQQPLNDVIVVQQGDGTAQTSYNQF